MKKLLLLVLFLLVRSVAAQSMTREQILEAAIKDACRLAVVFLEGSDASFSASRVEVQPSTDAVGAMDVWLPDSTGLAAFERSLGLNGRGRPWLEIIDARHARRILAAHYR